MPSTAVFVCHGVYMMYVDRRHVLEWLAVDSRIDHHVVLLEQAPQAPIQALPTHTLHRAP